MDDRTIEQRLFDIEQQLQRIREDTTHYGIWAADYSEEIGWLRDSTGRLISGPYAVISASLDLLKQLESRMGANGFKYEIREIK